MQQITISQQEALIISIFSRGFLLLLRNFDANADKFQDDVLLNLSKRVRALTGLNWVFKPLNI